MIFNSLDYAAFLLIVLPLYYLLPHRAQNGMLLVASYIFYGWWDWRFCSLLALSTGVDYFVASRIPRAEPEHRQRWLMISLVVNLGVLGFFKYFNFFIDSFQGLFQLLGWTADWPTLHIILPMGISFYTFQTLSYTIDVYRGEKPAQDLLSFALYVAFFPQLVAGPIERAGRLLGALENPRTVTRQNLRDGAWLILMGMFRKVVIADTAAGFATKCFSAPEQHSSIALLIGLYLFSLQIYADFAGYSEIARGTALLLGVELVVNFRQPYFSKNITEFWRRWHISLSSWLRDYLYISLGGNRKGVRRTYVNLMLTMLLGGLWHGANWTFVVWGGMHGTYLAVHKWLMGWVQEVKDHWLVSFAKMVVTFNLVALTWIFFRAADFAHAWSYLTGMMALRGPWLALGEPTLILEPAVSLVLLTFCLLMLDIPIAAADDHTVVNRWPWVWRGVLIAFLVLEIMLFSGGDDVPFIYFQF
ncbi:MAG: MBOAT family protein [Vulcanimicrobiota bacterium]